MRRCQSPRLPDAQRRALLGSAVVGLGAIALGLRPTGGDEHPKRHLALAVGSGAPHGYAHLGVMRAFEARGTRRGWAGVISPHEQFGALAAALMAERLRLRGSPPEAVLACQQNLLARQVPDEVAPVANLAFAPLDLGYGADGLAYPAYVKPVKAAFSVLARQVASRAELQAHTRFC